jgi:non-homologous end joining protein Ku
MSKALELQDNDYIEIDDDLISKYKEMSEKIINLVNRVKIRKTKK